MLFLVDANLPRSTVLLLRRFGHTADHVRDIGMGGAPDSEIAARARQTMAVLMTRDIDFADIRNYPPDRYFGIVVLRMPDDAVAADILRLTERFLKETDLLGRVPQHLVILESNRVRFRPALD
jgi:predicted nuclease of predicted toxin-antitoxin system